ncbi:hypothetical protein DV735_g1200, partial [Chaetothyriales sp. CBS 134920]
MAHLRILAVCLYTVSFVLLLLVETGNLTNAALIRDTYWLKIGLANVIPNSVPNAVFINSIARSIGLHDFYQVGLPQPLYWFNPVEIIMSELLAGASIALPTQVTDALHIVRDASRWMFAFYLAGISLTFLCIFLLSLPWLTFLAFFCTVAPSAIGTSIFTIFCNTFSGAADLNITAHLGTR